MPRSRKIAHFLLVAAAAMGRPSAGPAAAQDVTAATDAAPRIYACGIALDRVTEAAEAAEWQAADAAYNQLVDVMDAARADLEPALGQPAAEAFGAAYARLNDLDVALRSEDAVRVRSLAAEIMRALATLGTGGLGSFAGHEAQVAAWQQALQEIGGHLGAGRWIPMRNAALGLYEAVQSQGVGLADATGAEGGRQVAIARVFAMRLFVAALDQDKAAGEQARAHAGRALTRLLELMGAVRVTATPAASDGQPRMRAYLSSPGPDGSVTMPIKAEQLPPGGLGSFHLEARWSPEQLQLVDVQWSMGRGETDRDDAAGVLTLRMPQAPTGPSEPTVVATLLFNLRGTQFDPRDYLPAGSPAALKANLDAARRALRLGDLAAVGRELSAAYQLLAPGIDASAAPAIGDALAQAGLPDDLSPLLLVMVERVTEPSLRSEAAVTTDVLLEDLDRFEDSLEATMVSFGRQLRGAEGTGIPVLIRVLSLTDTSGAEVAPVLGVSGQVLLTEASPTPTVRPLATAAPTASAAAGVGSGTGTSAAGGNPAAAPAAPGGRGGGGVVVILGAVLALALAGAWAAGRRQDGPAAAE